MAIVSVENLKMSYDKGRVKALKGVTFDVEEGEIFGLIAGLVLSITGTGFEIAEKFAIRFEYEHVF